MSREVHVRFCERPEVKLLRPTHPHFHPAPKQGLFADRFVVFSGGKLERRKGQDLVVLAFRVFAQRHPEALLVTAWSSPWSQVARTLEKNAAVKPVSYRPDGQVGVLTWVQANGIPRRQVVDLGPVPNAEMARILREVDVALFPNRAEGGTNLVAMECMACGLPTILYQPPCSMTGLTQGRLARETMRSGSSASSFQAS